MTCGTNPRLLTTSRQCYRHDFAAYEKGTDRQPNDWEPAEFRCQSCGALQCPDCDGTGEVHTYEHGMDFECGRSCMGRCEGCGGEQVIDG